MSRKTDLQERASELGVEDVENKTKAELEEAIAQKEAQGEEDKQTSEDGAPETDRAEDEGDQGQPNEGQNDTRQLNDGTVPGVSAETTRSDAPPMGVTGAPAKMGSTVAGTGDPLAKKGGGEFGSGNDPAKPIGSAVEAGHYHQMDTHEGTAARINQTSDQALDALGRRQTMDQTYVSPETRLERQQKNEDGTPKVMRYRVQKDTRTVENGIPRELKAGTIVTSVTYDLEKMRRQGVVLEPIVDELNRTQEEREESQKRIAKLQEEDQRARESGDPARMQAAEARRARFTGEIDDAEARRSVQAATGRPAGAEGGTAAATGMNPREAARQPAAAAAAADANDRTASGARGSNPRGTDHEAAREPRPRTGRR